MNKFIAFIIFFIFSFDANAKIPTINVYTIKNIMSLEYGFAKELKELFEKKNNAKLNFIVFNSSSDLLMRLKLEDKKTKADVVIGLDYYYMEDAKDLNLFMEHEIDASGLNFPIPWGEEKFLPYEYGYLSFLYKKDKIKNPPKNFEDISKSNEIKLVISNPYTSIPGFGLVLWLKEIYGSKSSRIWNKIKPRIVSITKSWSQAYTLFHKGEANMMLSYTNDANHLKENGKLGFEVALFDDGQFLQCSVVGIINKTKYKKESIELLKTILETSLQEKAMKKTWMYPVNGKNKNCKKVKTTRSLHPKVVSLNRRPWVKEWRNALSKLPA